MTACAQGHCPLRGNGRAYRNFKIHHLLGKGTHLVVEAKSVFPLLFRCEDKITLSFLCTVHDGFAIGTNHAVIDVKGTA